MDIAWNRGCDIQMKLSVLVSLLLAVGMAVWAEQPMPKMVTVDPLNERRET